jgi:hypothetical protein
MRYVPNSWGIMQKQNAIAVSPGPPGNHEARAASKQVVMFQPQGDSSDSSDESYEEMWTSTTSSSEISVLWT